MLPADSHVHSEWSWDAADGSMEGTCRRAVEIGLPGVAFTEHADFTPWRVMAAGEEVPWGERGVSSSVPAGAFDIDGYSRCLERCRGLFPGLRIMSGVELGEPHRFRDEARAVLAGHPFDRILGSIHCIPDGEALIDASSPGFLGSGGGLMERVRAYFAEVLALVRDAPAFAVLAHATYPQRYWPAGEPSWSPALFEEEIRAVLAAAAHSGLALESNTTRGRSPDRGLCPPPEVVRWWHQAGGQAVCLGSDAHDPSTLAAAFPAAAEMLEAAGFRRPRDPTDLWLR